MYSKYEYYDSLRAINELLKSNAAHISRKYTRLEILPGWLGGLNKIFSAIKESGIDDVVVQQISESNGNFQIFYFGGDDALHKLISAHERELTRVCDICGEPSFKVEIDGKFRNRCMIHAKDSLNYSDATVDKIKAEIAKIKKTFNFDAE